MTHEIQAFVITGPMCSGKTTKEMEMIESFGREKCLLIKPRTDTRSGEMKIKTHDGKSMEVDKEVDPNSPDLLCLANENPEKIIVIDEANFFPANVLVPAVLNLIYISRIVVVSGLTHDAYKEPFGATLPLIEQLENMNIDFELIQLMAICDHCQQHNAVHTYRLTPRSNNSQIEVGGTDKYGPACDDCYPLLAK